jgi:hypothetical protein
MWGNFAAGESNLFEMMGSCRCRVVNSHTMRNAPRTGHRFVLGSTRLTIALLIMALGCAGILLAQRGLFALLGGNVTSFWGPVLVGSGLVFAAFVLARFRNDLVDD